MHLHTTNRPYPTAVRAMDFGASYLTNAHFADLLLWLGRACSGLTQCCIDAAVAVADVDCLPVLQMSILSRCLVLADPP
jgi:hypothetical protein